MLAHDRIVFLQLDLARRVLLVLRRGVEVSGSRGRFELDLFALALLRHRVPLLPRRLGHLSAALREHTHAAVTLDAAAHPAGLAGSGIHEHHVRSVDVTLALEDAATTRRLAPRL